MVIAISFCYFLVLCNFDNLHYVTEVAIAAQGVYFFSTKHFVVVKRLVRPNDSLDYADDRLKMKVLTKIGHPKWVVGSISY